MDKKYITLFKELAQASAASAESVMDYNRTQNDEKGLETATIMRDDYQSLADRIADANDNYEMTKGDAAKLLVGAIIQVNQVQDRITSLRKALTGYQTDIIPKLQDVLDNSTDDAHATQLANEKFVIENQE